MILVDYGYKSATDLMAERGLSDAFQAAQARTAEAAARLVTAPPGFMTRADETADIEPMKAALERIAAHFDDIVVLGTGGSSLGAQAASAIAPYRDGPKRRLYFPDSLDPYEMDRLIRDLDLKRTHFLVISKSGGTGETLAQLIAFHEELKRITDSNPAEHFTFITEPGARALRAYGEMLGSPIIDHPDDVGGRFSVLTAVGMLPAMLLGLDVAAFRRGANHMLEALRKDAATHIAVEGAAIAYTMQEEQDTHQIVTMAYAESLRAYTRWFAQLWAESLGKNGRGSTPIAAVGPVDQHSQLQLFLDGPADKIFTIISVPGLGIGPELPAETAQKFGLEYMAGKTIGDMVACQARATADTLRGRGSLVRTLALEGLDEENLGALFMAMMLETVLMADLMGIDAYDQPAVEEGKILTRRYLGDLQS